jgi:hypothetical protein
MSLHSRSFSIESIVRDAGEFTPIRGGCHPTLQS